MQKTLPNNFFDRYKGEPQDSPETGNWVEVWFGDEQQIVVEVFNDLNTSNIEDIVDILINNQSKDPKADKIGLVGYRKLSRPINTGDSIRFYENEQLVQTWTATEDDWIVE